MTTIQVSAEAMKETGLDWEGLVCPGGFVLLHVENGLITLRDTKCGVVDDNGEWTYPEERVPRITTTRQALLETGIASLVKTVHNLLPMSKARADDSSGEIVFWHNVKGLTPKYEARYCPLIAKHLAQSTATIKDGNVEVSQ